MKTATKIVERCFLVNLDRRPDRLGQWMKQLPEPWPFPPVERFAAIDGKKVPTPPQWQCGNGAWGCYRSHLAILEKCLMEGIESYVVFEDDAGFVPDFAEKLIGYALELPADWGLAYLGGQHLFVGKHPPEKISERVYRPYNVNRTHAFMVRGTDTMRRIYRHLTWNKWQAKHHIDHHLGRLIQREYMVSVRGKAIDRERVVTYAPDRWLAGQLPSKSNICGRKWSQTRFFNDAANADLSDEPFFAVLGPHRSGTSCVAMVMHHLGVHMGNQLSGYEGTGGGEATGLATLCEEAMKFPLTDPLWSDEVLTQRLRGWCVQRKGEAQRDQTVAGGKYPHLCRFAENLLTGLGTSLRVISVERPINQAIRSLQTRSRKHPGEWFSGSDDQCAQLQRSLLEHRDRFLKDHSEVPRHRIIFDELLTDPAREIDRLIGFLGIEPTADERKAAIAHVDPNLKHHA